MRSGRRFLGVAAILLGTMALAPSAAASSPIGQVLLTKTCDAYNHCTVQTSTNGPIPVGTQGFYLGPVFNNRLASRITLVTPDGATASGLCTLSYSTGLGTCTFAKGTGWLTGFHAAIAVSTSPDFSVFTWTGTYHFDR